MAVKVLAGQCLAVLLVVVFYALFGTRLAVQSAAWGGVVAIVPAAYMAWRMARGARRGVPRRFLEAFYAGELGKWLLTLGLFYGLFSTRTLLLLPLLTGYGAALIVYWLALLPRRF